MLDSLIILWPLSNGWQPRTEVHSVLHTSWSTWKPWGKLNGKLKPRPPLPVRYVQEKDLVPVFSGWSHRGQKQKVWPLHSAKFLKCLICNALFPSQFRVVLTVLNVSDLSFLQAEQRSNWTLNNSNKESPTDILCLQDERRRTALHLESHFLSGGTSPVLNGECFS